MNVFEVVVLSIVEGVSEYLPISSTFHLLVTQKLLGIPSTDFIKLFEVVIQVGAIGAVAVVFGKELLQQKKLLAYLIVSFLPIAIAGFLLKDFIKDVLFETFVVTTVVFIGVGIVFLVIEWLVSKKKIHLKQSISDISYTEAIYIGIFQMFALIPGVSRAGAVLVGMMARGYKREEAAKYSFLLSLPTIGAAGTYDLVDSREVLLNQSGEWWLLLVGIICSFSIALIVVNTLIEYLKKNSLVVFGWYRIIGGIMLLLFLQ